MNLVQICPNCYRKSECYPWFSPPLLSRCLALAQKLLEGRSKGGFSGKITGLIRFFLLHCHSSLLLTVWLDGRFWCSRHLRRSWHSCTTRSATNICSRFTRIVRKLIINKTTNGFNFLKIILLNSKRLFPLLFLLLRILANFFLLCFLRAREPRLHISADTTYHLPARFHVTEERTFQLFLFRHCSKLPKFTSIYAHGNGPGSSWA